VNEPKRIFYRGVPMIEGWPQRIQAAQYIQSLTLEGNLISRLPYGTEQHNWHADEIPCHDCRVLEGELTARTLFAD
jgi:hypothetical protein